MGGYAPIWVQPTMRWQQPTWGFNVPKAALDTLSPTLSGLGATTPSVVAPAGNDLAAAVLGGVLKAVVYGVCGYYVGKWAGASRGWTAASTALFGPIGTAGAVYFTGKKRG